MVLQRLQKKYGVSKKQHSIYNPKKLEDNRILAKERKN
jgi:hypothetical protein